LRNVFRDRMVSSWWEVRSLRFLAGEYGGRASWATVRGDLVIGVGDFSYVGGRHPTDGFSRATVG
jgi:hypothetical protein